MSKRLFRENSAFYSAIEKTGTNCWLKQKMLVSFSPLRKRSKIDQFRDDVKIVIQCYPKLSTFCLHFYVKMVLPHFSFKDWEMILEIKYYLDLVDYKTYAQNETVLKILTTKFLQS